MTSRGPDDEFCGGTSSTGGSNGKLLNQQQEDDEEEDVGNSSDIESGTDRGKLHLSSHSKKQRKARTAFSDHQLQTLENNFERQKYLSVQDRMELAAKAGADAVSPSAAEEAASTEGRTTHTAAEASDDEQVWS